MGCWQLRCAPRAATPVLVCVFALLTGGPAAPAARADVPGVRAILPVGEGASASLTDLAANEATGAVPASFTDEETPFEDLTDDAPHMTDALIDQDFPASTIALGGSAESVESPEAGVTIAWDSLGVPHISGQTQAEVMFGAGYAQAEARLFTMDVLRHLGEGELTSLIGPGTNDSTVAMDAQVLAQSDYDAAERATQFANLPGQYGAAGQAAIDDENAYTAGINARIAYDRQNPLSMPAEYAATGSSPQPWTDADSVAVAAEINQGFDLGGGFADVDGEIVSELRSRLGGAAGNAAFADLSFQDDPLAPVTTTTRFDYPQPDRVDPAAVALPDADSVQAVDPVVAVTGAGATADHGVAAAGLAGPAAGRGAPAAARSTTAPGDPLAPAWISRLALSHLAKPGGDSFAVLVGAKHSGSGHPIADMGPQVDFFSPELLLDEALSGPGIAVRGAALPGAAPVPLVGHTNSFAWSITIGVGQHITTYALKLCNPDGSPASRSSTAYVYDGRCVPMLQRTVTETTVTSLDNPAAPQTFAIHTLRSIYGPIIATATVHGAPVALARDDTTYDHLAGTGVVLAELSTGAVSSPQSFIDVTRQAPFSLNWFYVDAHNIAWTLSGDYALPATRTVHRTVTVRRGGAVQRRRISYTEGPSETFPVWGTGAWNPPGFRSDATAAGGLTTFGSDDLARSKLPHVINPASGLITNWNNKPAPGWRASDDDWYFGPVHRVQMYRRRLSAALRESHGRIDEAQLVSLVESADTADLRGELDLPYLLKVIERADPSPQVQPLVALLTAWMDVGAHRSDTTGSGYDDDGAAARLMDAWWPLLVPAMLTPVLGSDAYTQATDTEDTSIDDPPNTDAEAWYNGWYGQVEQDLRDVLATAGSTSARSATFTRSARVSTSTTSAALKRVSGHFSRIYCGASASVNGTLARCAQVLSATLLQAAASVAKAQGTTDPLDWTLPDTCPVPASGYPDCDEIVFSATGAIDTPPVPWQNRPTYQQVVAFGG